VFPGITQAKDYMPSNHSNTDVVGSEILSRSGCNSTHQFTPPSVEKFSLENARKAFAKASKISHPVTTRAAGNPFMLETDEHVVVDSGGEEYISAGNIWRVNRLDRGHDPVMVTEVQHRTGSGQLGTFNQALTRTVERLLQVPGIQVQTRSGKSLAFAVIRCGSNGARHQNPLSRKAFG